MNQYNWLITELLMEQRKRELAAPPHALPEPPERAGLRRTLAGAMLKAGLRLDPAAGERLAAALALAPEGRR